ncbi:hypothetical protein CW751_07445 [Brumimicrobium salinarum]|uniref:Uncharacterized protein n=1 Tax=Brumimicrobium salinarum TaxID=2058658 RepID=A0A2I0R335_9FLAO|nr:SiaB family protein kinase [Brumimicrobium salinarum]PKR80992.1 hypothetical protein CW751_07445 [Brumimicrobium salinarum]
MGKTKQLNISIDEIFEDLREKFSTSDSGYIMMSHFGEFSQDLVNSLSEGLEYIMLNRETPKKLTKRMFTVMIEGLQNIRIHGARDTKGKQYGHVMIKEDNGVYTASFGNVVNFKSQKLLVKHLNNLNRMNSVEIKEFYLENLSNGMMTEKGGAGLGFITIKLKSKSNIAYRFYDYTNTQSYFEMEVELP